MRMQLSRGWGSGWLSESPRPGSRGFPRALIYSPPAFDASRMHPRRRRDVLCDGHPRWPAHPCRPRLRLVVDGQRCPRFQPTHGPSEGSVVGVAPSVPILYPPALCVLCVRDGFTALGFRLSRLSPRYDAPEVRWGYSAAPGVFGGLRLVQHEIMSFTTLSLTPERRVLATLSGVRRT